MRLAAGAPAAIGALAVALSGALSILATCQRTGSGGMGLSIVHSGASDAAAPRESPARGTPDAFDAAVGSDAPRSEDAGSPATSAPSLSRVVAAGDIACNGCSQGATAALVEQLLSSDNLAAVLVLGDLAYASGSAAEFQRYYTPSWGRPEILRLTHPVPGNHEYASGSANGYFDYFDGVGREAGPAGPRGQGYYSFDVGAWHVIGLNSSDECKYVPCGETSAQHDWLVADLASHPAPCTLAFWHHPRFQAGTSSGELDAAGPLWDVLYAAGVDIVLNGHEHGYQQLSPLDDAGQLDFTRGIRTFVVGTGGGEFDTTFGGPHLGVLETSITGSYGVLELTLLAGSYQWQFITVDGSSPSAAAGSGICH